MQNELDIVRDVSQRLDRAGLAYMLTGSMAMNYYAQPRMTRDIDLVIALERSDAEKIVDLFRPDYYVSEEAVRDCIATKSIFNLIHQESVIKVDCVVRKDTPYHHAEFERRHQIKIDNFSTWIATKEDLIISKLEWARDLHSEIQIRDAKNLVASTSGRASWACLSSGRKSEPGWRHTMNDTAPEIAKEMRVRLEKLPNAMRFKMGVEMFEAARCMIVASFPRNLSAHELKRRLYERVYGEALPF